MNRPGILVVDDDPDNGLNVKSVLEKHGYRISVCESAKEAFKLLAIEIPDIILLDVVLPDIPGTEFCKALKNDPRYAGIPVILISGTRTSEENYQAGIQAGAMEYFFRPLSNRMLLDKIREILSASRDIEDQAAADREMLSFEDLSHRNTIETSTLFNSAPLRKEYPEAFQNSVKEYNLLIDLALKEKYYKIESSLSERLYQLTENLGFLNAGAKDLMDIHIQCLQSRFEKANLKQQKILLEESRILLIGILGNLVNHYRRKSF